LRSTFAASSGAGWAGPLLEGISGAAALVVGIPTILGLGMSLGLGSSIGGWFDVPALVFIWLPIVWSIMIGGGAILNARGQASAVSRFRWLAVLAFSFTALAVLVVAPAGPMVLVPYVLAFITAAIGELRARNGEAPASVGGIVAAGLASVAALGIVGLTLRGLAS
jgi:hypothetical protein